jgi:L-ascorbate metabolism protein UlaG (beta-lactamase superfamily)
MTRRTGAALAALIEQLEVPPGMLALWALGQVGFVIKGGATIAVIDPYLSDAITARGGPQRRIPIPIQPDLLSSTDIVLCTHEHDDHTDVATLKPLLDAAPHARAVVSPQSVDKLRNAGVSADQLEVPALGKAQQIKELRYTAIPAAHETLEVDAEQQSRWMGFLIECNGVTLFHAGDTIMKDEISRALAGQHIDIALLPMNGRDYFREQQGIVGNLLPREATELAHGLQADVLIPMHNDLFAGNRLNPAELWDDLDRRFPEQCCHMLQPGELYLYPGH